jgi:hypothetical protein
MEKKNPYVMTIGFNRRDPNHRKVAEFLNEMERGKAQYIVNAVMAYQGEMEWSSVSCIDEKMLRKIVGEILAEKERKNPDDFKKVQKDEKDSERKFQMDGKDIRNIMDSLNAFKMK